LSVQSNLFKDIIQTTKHDLKILPKYLLTMCLKQNSTYLSMIQCNNPDKRVKSSKYFFPKSTKCSISVPRSKKPFHADYCL